MYCLVDIISDPHCFVFVRAQGVQTLHVNTEREF